MRHGKFYIFLEKKDKCNKDFASIEELQTRIKKLVGNDLRFLNQLYFINDVITMFDNASCDKLSTRVKGHNWLNQWYEG
jgi:hypothetical protein